MMPIDEYTVECDQTESFKGASVLNGRQYAIVDTTASSITFHTVDADEQNIVTIPASKGDTFTVTLRSDLPNAAGAETVVITGRGEGAEVCLGMDVDHWVIDNCQVDSITVNDVPQTDGSILFGSLQNINVIDVRLEDEEFTYTGSEVCPKVTLADETPLVEGIDYEIEYENNVNVTYIGSEARVIIHGIGKYTGEKTLLFDISYGKDSGMLHLPTELTEVRSGAFANTAAKMVVVPAGTTAIADDAFPEDVILVFTKDSPLIDWAKEKGIRYRVQ